MEVSSKETQEVSKLRYKLYKRLRSIRKSKGISAREMADLLGLVTEAAYYKKETGVIRFSIEEARLIAQKLRMSIDEIFFADEVSCGDTYQESTGTEGT
ncbi:MAG: helix-turn-helix transcriptional regulator [Syntrophomonadaceae bacterium]|nr:helix-turn-helix transcriptional regulator [Syntrophomonadaceae bacterium]